FPNPATTTLIIDVGYDPRWLGAELTILNSLGQPVCRRAVNTTQLTLAIGNLKAGVYFIRAERAGQQIRKSFVKL
ncbi:MAG TPA: T9SS type A sorting domain-containing protein, partial [Chitinophagaceae bacterium]